MITALLGLVAVFEIEGDEEHLLECRVEAWTSKGDALVLDEESGRLTEAYGIPGFVFVQVTREGVSLPRVVPKTKPKAVVVL